MHVEANIVHCKVKKICCRGFFLRRDFLRLGSPLYCQSLDIPDETSNKIVRNNYKSAEEDQEECREASEEIQNHTPFIGEKMDVSEVTPKKISDIVNRKISDASSEGTLVKSRSSTLTFRDVMLSMIHPSSESSSDVESVSDEDDDYLIVQQAKPDSLLENSDDEKSDNEDSTAVTARKTSPERKLDECSITDVTTDLTQEYEVAMETSSDQQGVVTSEVDGVDIDTFDNAAQEVSSIDQGEDTVILDVKREPRQSSSVTVEPSPESKQSESSIEISPDNTDSSLLRTGTSSGATTLHKAAEMSFNDISVKLSLQLPESHLEGCEENCLNGATNFALEEDEEEFEEEDGVHQRAGGPVPLTRVKCIVSMTTPRDARAHGATDCPSFVEFDMSVDGFGCLFLPAISPQVTPGKVVCFDLLSEMSAVVLVVA